MAELSGDIIEHLVQEIFSERNGFNCVQETYKESGISGDYSVKIPDCAYDTRMSSAVQE